MTELFADPSRPFFQSAGFLRIGKINDKLYSTYISGHFQKAGKKIKDEASRLLQEEELVFFKYRDLLTKQQWFLLKAIAHEGEVYYPTSKDFISKYALGSSATVLRSLHALLSKEMIYSDYNPEGLRFYSVYDVLFWRWMQRF